jgi:two-component system invasion response regulator UvrY
MHNISVLIVDDHEIVRAGFKQLLGTADDIKVIAEASTGEEAIELSIRHQPNVVVMDINMPGIGGIEAITRINARLPQARIIALTVHESEPFPTRVMEAGAQAYLSKRCAPQELVQAVRETYAGGSYISEGVRAEMAKAKLDQTNPLAKLSNREFQVFNLMAQGKSAVDVGKSMHLSHKTIYTHKANIQKKLDLETHLGIIQFARQHNLIDD